MEQKPINLRKLLDEGFEYDFVTLIGFETFKRGEEIALYDRMNDIVYLRGERYDGVEHFDWSEDSELQEPFGYQEGSYIPKIK